MGLHKRSEVELSDDVLVYSPSPLEETLDVTGLIELQLSVSSSSSDTDFPGKLVDVYPHGSAMILHDT